MAQKFITYKQRPLVRMGNLIFYGDQNEKCYVMMSIIDTQNKDDLMLSGKVEVQLLLTARRGTCQEGRKTGTLRRIRSRERLARHCEQVIFGENSKSISDRNAVAFFMLSYAVGGNRTDRLNAAPSVSRTRANIKRISFPVSASVFRTPGQYASFSSVQSLTFS